jgi:YgiT-type zinc finger domain-containing protein
VWDQEVAEMLTSCYICSGEIIDLRTTVHFQWGKKVYVIDNVPTHVCKRCGEKYFEAGVYHRLEKLSEIHAGILSHAASYAIQFGEPLVAAER